MPCYRPPVVKKKVESETGYWVSKLSKRKFQKPPEKTYPGNYTRLSRMPHGCWVGLARGKGGRHGGGKGQGRDEEGQMNHGLKGRSGGDEIERGVADAKNEAAFLLVHRRVAPEKASQPIGCVSLISEHSG